MGDPINDPVHEGAGGRESGDVTSEPRPPAFPSVDREQPHGDVWQPARDELFAPPTPPSPPATPVVRVAGSPRTPMWRWLVALIATIAVIGVVAGVSYLAVRRVGTPSAVSHYAPASTPLYAEIDLNMPGDQLDQLASFMSHFPGFADPSSFQQKIDDSLNQLLVSSGSGLTWAQDVAPWFGKQVAFFGNPLAANASNTNLSTTSAPPMAIILSVTDRTQLEQVIQPKLNSAGATSSTYDGETLWTLPDATDVVAVTDDALLLGTGEQVKMALDVKTGRQASLADDDFFLQQLASLHPDRLATFYLDYGAMAASLSNSLGAAGSLIPGAPPLDLVNQLAAVKMVGEARADGNHLAIDMRSSHPTGDNVPPLPSNRRTSLAERMPADSLVYFETRDLGQAIKYLANTLLSSAAASPAPSGGLDVALQSITELLGTQPQDYLDFVQDVGVSVSYANDKLGVGLVATVDDQAVASTRVERLLSAVRTLGAFGSNSGVTVEDEQHGDVTITMIHVTGTQPSMPGMAGPTVPNLNIGVAVANGQLLIGLDDFVANALDRTAADSLAANSRFQSAASVAGDNAGITFVDIAGIRTALEQAIPAASLQNYEQNEKPFLEPLDYLLQYSVTDGDISEGHTFLYVR
jgi:Protein of unknown function (DUF3352)